MYDPKDPFSDQYQGEARAYIKRYFLDWSDDQNFRAIAPQYAQIADQLMMAACFDHDERMACLRKLREALDHHVRSVKP